MTELAAEPLEHEDFFYAVPEGRNFPKAVDDEFHSGHFPKTIEDGFRIRRVDGSSSEHARTGMAWDMIELRRRANGENWKVFPGLSSDDPDLISKRHELWAETKDYLSRLPADGMPVHVEASLAIRPYNYFQPPVSRPKDEPPPLQVLTLPVGFGYAKHLSHRPDSFIDVGNIFVDPGFRGLGVGRAILHALLNESPQDVEIEAMIRREDARIIELATAIGFSAVPFRDEVVNVGDRLDLYRAPSARDVTAHLELANPWLRTRQAVGPTERLVKSNAKVLTSSPSA